ncbi:MAG: hypothetical protein ACXW30_03700 [Micavibrio sp.]
MNEIQTNKPSAPPEPVAAPLDSVSAPARIASFADQFFIHTEKRLPHLDQGPIKAYAASGLSDVSQATHFALVCEPHLTPRSRSAAAYAGIISPNLLKLVASGAMYWPPARGELYVFIYENIINKPMTPEGQFRGLGWKPDLVEAAVVKPLIFSLMDLRDADVIHGNIRPSNMFPVGPASGVDRVILGECLSAPPSFNQPVMFETIERAMADPIGRGPPHLDGDMYALGASLAVIMRQRDPLEGLSDDDIIRFKIDQGSYMALTGKDRFTGDILELLRGLLNDDRDQRWTIENVMSWMDGQRLTPKQAVKKIKAARPVHFLDERYFRPALLAMDLGKNQSEAAQLVESGNMEQWVSRSLEDPAVQKRLESAIETTSEHGRGPGFWDRLLCRVSIALDPEAPIRYKEISLNPEGFGTALTEALITKKNIQPYIDLINHQTVMFWLTAQTETQVDVGSIVSRFDSCLAFLRQQNIAYGVERCLYFLNPEANCLSEKIKGYYVRDPEDMMDAFEKISKSPSRPELFFDRHIISFLSVKDRQNIDPYLMELNAEEIHRRILGNIKTLATIQQRSRLDKFPGICKWISQILDPVYERFHDRELRISMKAKVAQLVEGGDITKIAAIIDSPATMQKDTESYNQARQDYFKLRQENAQLEVKLADPGAFSKGIGREVAALVSCILAGITILFFVFMIFSKGALF